MERISPPARSRSSRDDAGARVGSKRSGAPTSASRAWLRAHSSKVSSNRSIFRSASANWLRSPPEKSASTIAYGSQPSHNFDAGCGEGVQVQGRALRRADQLRRRQPSRAREVVDLVVALIPDTGRVHPPQHVAAPIGPRQPDVLADRERHRPARAMDLVSQLNPGGRRADNQHAAGGKLARISIVERREALD